MSVTPLDFGAWISICCGFTLLRANVVPRRHGGVDSGRARVVAGAVLIIVGLAVLAVALVYHFLRGH
jgi:hypothetical protein